MGLHYSAVLTQNDSSSSNNKYNEYESNADWNEITSRNVEIHIIQK